MPTCLGAFAYFVPASLMFYEEGGSMVLEFNSSSKYPAAMAETYRTMSGGVDVSQHYGKKVNTIDGVSWMAAIQTFADTLSISRDAGSRFNSAINGGYTNQFFYRNGPFAPSAASVAVSFTDGTSVTLPWAGQMRATPDGSDASEAWLASLCRKVASVTASRRGDGSSSEESHAGFGPVGPPEIGTRRTAVPTSTTWRDISATYGVDVRAYCLDKTCLGIKREGTTAIMRVASFHASGCSVACESFTQPDGIVATGSHTLQFYIDVGRILTKINTWRTAGTITNTIFDVRGNGGGLVMLMLQLSYAITKDTSIFNNTLYGAWPHNRAFNALAMACVGQMPFLGRTTADAQARSQAAFTACHSLRTTEGMPFAPVTWNKDTAGGFDPTVTSGRGIDTTGVEQGSEGRRTTYTNAQLLDKTWWCPGGGDGAGTCRGLGIQYNHDKCTSMCYPSNRAEWTTGFSSMLAWSFMAPGYAYPTGSQASPTPNTILSDGICGSACAMFARMMQDKYYMRVLTVGGHPLEAQQYATFGGGEVWDTSNRVKTWLRQIAYNTVDNGEYPHPMPVDGQKLAFVPRMVFSLENATGLPMEFIFRPSNIRMNYTRNMMLPETSATLGTTYASVATRIAACAADTCNGCSTSATPCPTTYPTMPSCQAPLENITTSPVPTASVAMPSRASPWLSVLIALTATAVAAHY